MQKTVRVKYEDTENTIKKKVQKAEQELFLEAIPLYFDGKIEIKGRKVHVLQ